MINDPVIYYTMDNADISGTTITDRGSSGNNGTLKNSPTTGTAGKINQAITFTGSSSQWIETTANLGSNPWSGTFTFACWFKTSAPGVLMFVDAGQTGNTGTDDRFFYIDTNGKLFFGFFDVSFGTRSLTSSASVDDGNWHHAAATCQAGVGFAIYIDGVSVGTNTAGGNAYGGYSTSYLQVVNSSPNLGWSNIPSGYYTGIVDEVRVYNRSLSSTEITALYNFTGSLPTFQAGGLLAW